MLLAGALVLFNRVILQHEVIWQVSTQYWKNRMVDLGLKAGLAFIVGIGILPVVGGFTSLFLRERRGDPRYRAFVAFFASSVLCVVLYTAIKAAYLSTIFATLVEERNLIYLSPLMLLGTAMVFESRQIDWRVVGAVSLFVVWLVYDKPFQLLFPYFEAPGFAILAVVNRAFLVDGRDPEDRARGDPRGRPARRSASRMTPVVGVATATLVRGLDADIGDRDDGGLRPLRQPVPEQPPGAARLDRPAGRTVRRSRTSARRSRTRTASS